ncbi:MAG: OmpA family protein [Treponema sp.]|nr:OmpA family protein [Candidatus Treponema equi]
MNRVQKIVVYAISFFCFSQVLFGQDALLQYNGNGSYIYIERTDLRRYDNGKYTGLVSREIRSFISPVGVPEGANPDDSYYDGNFYVAEGTKRASASVGEEINGSIPSTFKITSDGQLVMIKDKGYPTFRSFPAFTKKRIKLGDKWQAKAERIVDPLNKGVKTKMPIYVEYTYLRDDSFHGEEVYVISAEWATRYGLAATLDFGGDRDLKFAQGRHRANILVSKDTGNALVVRDTVDEEFEYLDGNKVAFRGTISMFTEYPPAYNREKLFPALQRIASISKEELKEIMDKPVDDVAAHDKVTGAKGADSLGAEETGRGQTKDTEKAAGTGLSEDQLAWAGTGSQGVEGKTGKQGGNGRSASKSGSAKQSSGKRSQVLNNLTNDSFNSAEETSSGEKKVTVENTSAGIRLTMQNLNFKPDSAELLPGENSRLDQIADLLKLVPEQMFLVEGHTASVGNPKGEMNLSIERADSIIQAMVKRGVPKDRFICKGSGGTKPVSDNGTSEGRAKNRRVEITILE